LATSAPLAHQHITVSILFGGSIGTLGLFLVAMSRRHQDLRLRDQVDQRIGLAIAQRLADTSC